MAAQACEAPGADMFLASAPNHSLWLGLVCVLEWPKDYDEDRDDTLPAIERDMNNVYLVTSRDGIHFDDEVRTCVTPRTVTRRHHSPYRDHTAQTTVVGSPAVCHSGCTCIVPSWPSKG